MNPNRISFIGVDFQGDQAVLATGAANGQPLGVETVPLHALEGHISSGARVAVAMSPRESVCRWLETPFSSAGKARKVLATVLDIQLPFPLEECVHSFVMERKSEKGTIGALAVAARHPMVEARLGSCAQQGIDPSVLDHEGLALWTQATLEVPQEGSDDDAQPRIVIYAGLDRACIVLGRGAQFINSHSCTLDHPAQMLRLLRAALGEPLGGVSWIWAGPRAADRSFDAVRQPIEQLAAGSSTTVEQPHAFLARALSRRMARPGTMPCNFRVGPFADARHALRSSRSLTRISVGMIVLGILLWGTALLNWRAGVTAKAAASHKFSNLYQQVTGMPTAGAKGVHAVTMARRAQDSSTKDLKRLQYLLAPSLTIPLLDLISAANSASLKIHECRLSDKTWRVAGLAKDRQSCDGLKAMALKAGFEVELSWGDAADGQDTIPFVMSFGGGA